MAQTLEEQIDLEIKKLEMDFNNGVQWSMHIMFKSLNRIKNKAWEAKKNHKKEIITAYNESWHNRYKPYNTAEKYYEETYKNK